VFRPARGTGGRCWWTQTLGGERSLYRRLCHAWPSLLQHRLDWQPPGPRNSISIIIGHCPWRFLRCRPRRRR